MPQQRWRDGACAPFLTFIPSLIIGTEGRRSGENVSDGAHVPSGMARVVGSPLSATSDGYQIRRTP